MPHTGGVCRRGEGRHPACSLELLDDLGVGPTSSLVDVGAGASRLVDVLLGRGFDDLTVLDVSEAGPAQARHRLGQAADRVRWVVADLLAWVPGRQFDVWHDRAVFHFLIRRTCGGTEMS